MSLQVDLRFEMSDRDIFPSFQDHLLKDNKDLSTQSAVV